MTVSRCTDRNILLSAEAYGIYSSCMYQPTMERYEKKMERFLDEGSFHIFVLLDQEKITGMMVIDLSSDVPEIEGIAISEDRRREGLGRELIRSVMEQQKLSSLRAETDDGSISFYRACGFSERKISREYPDGTVIRYICELGNDQFQIKEKQ